MAELTHVSPMICFGRRASVDLKRRSRITRLDVCLPVVGYYKREVRTRAEVRELELPASTSKEYVHGSLMRHSRWPSR